MEQLNETLNEVSGISDVLESGSEAVVQVAESIDYTELLNQLQYSLDVMNEYILYLTGFMLFFVIVLICYFGYKFFKLFF